MEELLKKIEGLIKKDLISDAIWEIKKIKEEKEKKDCLENILAVCVERGHGELALKISELLGKKLTQEEKMKIINFQIKKEWFRFATETTLRLFSPHSLDARMMINTINRKWREKDPDIEFVPYFDRF